MMHQTLSLPGNRRLAYVLSEGRGPTVIFLTGFRSDMTGSKALAVEAFCKARGQRFLRFDYTGHGQSSGDFKEGTIGAWKQDALDVIDRLGGEKNILVGSSMGAWIAFLCARERKIAGIVGISSAPDFTERRIWKQIGDEQKKALKEQGMFYAPACDGEDPYPITKQLIEEARDHLLLDAPIKVEAKVRLLHGLKDADVPWPMAMELFEKLTTPDATLTLVKDGGHRLSEPAQLELLCATLGRLL